MRLTGREIQHNVPVMQIAMEYMLLLMHRCSEFTQMDEKPAHIEPFWKRNILIHNLSEGLTPTEAIHKKRLHIISYPIHVSFFGTPQRKRDVRGRYANFGMKMLHCTEKIPFLEKTVV